MQENEIDVDGNKMPSDFWNYPYNPITGFRCSIYSDKRKSPGLDVKSVPAYYRNKFN